MPDTLRLNCMGIGQLENNIFEVNVTAVDTVASLRKAIKHEQPHDAHTFRRLTQILGKPSAFSKKKQTEKAYLCNRRCSPSHPSSGSRQNLRQTDTDTDSSFVLVLGLELAREMSAVRGDGDRTTRTSSGRCARPAVGKFVAAGKDEIGSDPFLEATASLFNPQDNIAQLRPVVPCFHNRRV
ncbi:hypothetical protein BJ138DRAFT_1130658 [Hygrophoropsis aurantiaca]|uniref:Uncharacterized protein n=1 Tax=Hygrophoropsis aurantiaca TaxID=72124 RepID=A0ACB7ZVQ7_9AGAM|nr:hypothetical protein BJ138DRAFT_1130658 [Hygrophoropsis aurantiaca]